MSQGPPCRTAISPAAWSSVRFRGVTPSECHKYAETTTIPPFKAPSSQAAASLPGEAAGEMSNGCSTACVSPMRLVAAWVMATDEQIRCQAMQWCAVHDGFSTTECKGLRGITMDCEGLRGTANDGEERRPWTATDCERPADLSTVAPTTPTTLAYRLTLFLPWLRRRAPPAGRSNSGAS